MHPEALRYPFRGSEILRRKKSLRRELLQRVDLVEKRVAILGGSTTHEVREVLELFLLDNGIKPSFYESGYNRFYEESVFENAALGDFRPDVIYLHTTNANLASPPAVHDTAEQVNQKLRAELVRFETIWERLRATYGCAIIQNNFELPHTRSLGNLDSSDIHGKSRFIMKLNEEFARHAAADGSFFINDICYLSSWLGLQHWHDRTAWHAYKYAMSYDAMPHLAHNIARIVAAIFGRSRKCLVLDLDDTLWGGVVGDVGVNEIQIGRQSAVAEAHLELQTYIKDLKERGVVLAVCSKNDYDTAISGLSHPAGALRPEDFATIKASWEPKHLRIDEIAAELNVGKDSLVFLDDNPAEREIVRRGLPEVLVPEPGEDITRFIEVLDREAFFEPAIVSGDDLHRTEYYHKNRERLELETKATDYGSYLASLEMVAEIRVFDEPHRERITQLINKTNQFNLTTKRCTVADVELLANDDAAIALYARLADKFGDNGLVSVAAGKVAGETLHLNLWLMSCRVIKRDLELAIFDEIVSRCRSRGVKTIKGYYYRTQKNGLVARHYETLGFSRVSIDDEENSEWEYTIPVTYECKNKHIRVTL